MRDSRKIRRKKWITSDARFVTGHSIEKMPTSKEDVSIAETMMHNIKLEIGSRGRYSKVIIDNSEITNIKGATLKVSTEQPTILILEVQHLHNQETYEIEGRFIANDEKFYTPGDIEKFVMNSFQEANGDWRGAYVILMKKLDSDRISVHSS